MNEAKKKGRKALTVAETMLKFQSHLIKHNHVYSLLFFSLQV